MHVYPSDFVLLQVAGGLSEHIVIIRNGPGYNTCATRRIPPHTQILDKEPLFGFQEVSSVGYSVVCAKCFCMVGTVELQLANAWEHLEGRPRGSNGVASMIQHLPKLPLSERFGLPPAIPCSGSCENVYCSTAHRDAAWRSHHSLLCPFTAHSSGSNNREDQKLARFYDFINLTNDIFKLAAQAVANIMLSAQRELENDGMDAETASSEAAWDALQRAWVPYSLGPKMLWWEVAPVPPVSPQEEAFLREGFKFQTEESLEILTEALKERAPALFAAFPAVLHLDVWASLAGMFELNGCMQSTTVASPVPAWAQDVYYNQDELEPQDWEAIRSYRAVQAYGGVELMMDGNDESEWVSVCSVFTPLQACFNRSRAPNACRLTRGDNGNVAIITQRDIEPGEKITLRSSGSGSIFDSDSENASSLSSGSQAALSRVGSVPPASRHKPEADNDRDP